MNYIQLQNQIANRLDQRTDLQQVIYDFSQIRINYWQTFFFYSSDAIDTSVTTSAGQNFYNLPNGMRQVRVMRLLIPGNNQSYSVTTSSVTLPQAIIPVSTVTGFTTNGGTINVGGQIVQYTGVVTSPAEFTGCTGGAGTLSNGAGVTQISPITTTTSQVTLPTTDIPVVSTAGFLPSGLISIGGTQVSYTSIDSTDFLGGAGGATTTVASGSSVQQIYGIWLPLIKIQYERMLDIDPLAPPNQALPIYWSPFGTQFRLYPNPDLSYQLELTGNEAPAAPVNDTDDNFWTEDAAELIIQDTCAEIAESYLHNGDMADRYRALALIQKKRLLKVSLDLGTGPMVFRGYL